ncbi:MAG: sulfite exporter TauE/SafE family protein [Candidatus Cloacimonetes bacterium]|nr:sulfite exporter TauE/SafE family protein [Candidatus Cloacimonadota bacterium]
MISYSILFFAGIAAGFINTLAGGGSALVLPILILMGVPSMQANATNRVAILFQNITGASQFSKHNKLQVKPFIHIVFAVIIGAIIGSFFAVKMRSAIFDKILGVVLIGIVLMMFKPHKTKNRFTKRIPKFLEFIIFLIVGFYGGFIQVGIGFIFLLTLSLVEELDLVRANALKVFMVMSYTFVAVAIFAFSKMIVWKYGIILAFGNTIGAYIGVKAAIQKGDKFIRIVMVIAVTLACLKLFGVFELFKNMKPQINTNLYEKREKILLQSY